MQYLFESVIPPILGFSVGVLCMSVYLKTYYLDPMEDLGIERFQKCEIHTTNCHSNWYEIVYKKER